MANWRREQLSNVIYSSKIASVISLGCFGDKPKLLIWFAGMTVTYYDRSLSLRVKMTLADQHYHNHPNHAALWVIFIFATSQGSALEWMCINSKIDFIKCLESLWRLQSYFTSFENTPRLLKTEIETSRKTETLSDAVLVLVFGMRRDLDLHFLRDKS